MITLTESEKLIIVANAIICFSLIPSIISADKPHWTTSILNFGLSFLYIKAYYKLKFKFVMLINILIGVFWLTMFFQKITG